MLSSYDDGSWLSANGDEAMMSPNGNRMLLSSYEDRCPWHTASTSNAVSQWENAMRPIQTSRAFGSAVRRARKDRGMSQVELAARAGVGRPWLSELETGKRTAELGRALSVLSALDLAVTFIPVLGPDGSTVDLGQIIGGDI